MIFREIERTSRNDDIPKEKQPEKIKFKMKNEGGFDSPKEEDSFELDEEVQPHIFVLMRSDRVRRKDERYSPPNFRSTFVLSTIND